MGYMLPVVPALTLKIALVPEMFTSVPAPVGNANGAESPVIVPMVTVTDDSESPVLR